jgi:hypothetical protein
MKNNYRRFCLVKTIVGSSFKEERRPFSRALGVGPGEYARVTAIDRDQNLLTVERSDGGITYDPRRLQGVSVFRED